MAKSTLNRAKTQKNDEFYTQLADIENEMRHYKEQFCGKVVFCNCDDPYESNFFKFFALSFKQLKLKQLIATCYSGSPISNKELSLFDHETAENKTTRQAHKIIINEAIDENADGAFDLQDIVLTLAKNEKNTLARLNGNGDFRSAECIELLKQADIVVTNPPFSLFREYVAQLLEFKKHFLIIGNLNAITYKEIFKLIKENKLWLGKNNGPKEYRVPDTGDYEHLTVTRIDEHGIKYTKMGNTGWYTNLDLLKRHEILTLYKEYNPEAFPKYDNYHAINVEKYYDIPCNYSGTIGVPITFLDKYNPEQFEILGIDRYVEDNPKYGHRFTINGRETYARIIIKSKGVK
jgi:hypothetical protein